MKPHLLFTGLVRLHILHHASQEAFYGLWMLERLVEHGHRITPGTLYPILHAMETAGYLASEEKEPVGRSRRFYSATPAGRALLEEGRAKVCELHADLCGEHPAPGEIIELEAEASGTA